MTLRKAFAMLVSVLDSTNLMRSSDTSNTSTAGSLFTIFRYYIRAASAGSPMSRHVGNARAKEKGAGSAGTRQQEKDERKEKS
eukprot:CAMPEP_0113884278 /NCGR_PEP_ID=MMETSP0780_2-20120614/10163_1 /TAXON_ID=652834 /ORGANISM="Palpitomonas bilix" /LENGTH=82 /DNA_ID=CAMNT_0000871869 /DNA_START=53 /DNA_END=301 /DNA_ORIENTATION=- /assembly_acc=CAM_ASM_000599